MICTHTTLTRLWTSMIKVPIRRRLRTFCERSRGDVDFSQALCQVQTIKHVIEDSRFDGCNQQEIAQQIQMRLPWAACGHWPLWSGFTET